MFTRGPLYGAVFFFFAAGVNHFANPNFYLPLIPPYFLFIEELNIISGLVEIAGALGLIFHHTRKMARYGLMIMLIAFIPSHLYFIEIGSCVNEGLCVPGWIAWIRLLLVHPLFIWWVYSIKN